LVEVTLQSTVEEWRFHQGWEGEAMGPIFSALGAFVGFVGGIWGLVVCLGIISSKAGTLAAILAFFILPATLSIAPWYVAFAENNWFPVLLVYGSGIGAVLLYQLGAWIGGER
jgi:uncharacterized membrane protein YkgB